MISIRELYNYLPPAMQSLAASVHGYRLRMQRYDSETDKLVEEALAREFWSVEQWKIWQGNRLDFILHRAATKVPYYRNLWLLRQQKGDKRSWSYLENWPVLDKDTVRENPLAFVADDINLSKTNKWETSGTTGKPITFYKSKSTERTWYALAEARWRQWYGVSRHDRWAILGGQVVAPINRAKPPFWVWNIALKQLYMSAYHLAPRFIPSYIQALNDYKVKYIYGYSSSINLLAQGITQFGLTPPKVAVVVTNAEPLYDYQRAAIENAFQCPVRETYGMTEMITAASECEAGNLHIWPEVGVLETLDKDEVPEFGLNENEFIATSLINTAMCLVRYRLGDQGSLRQNSTKCSCGRTLPILDKVEGRTEDLLYTVDGRCIGCLEVVLLSDMLPVRETQVIQEELDLIRVLVVPTTGYSSGTHAEIIRRVRKVMGNIKVIVDEVQEIPRGKNGKFRAVICMVNRPKTD